MRFVILQLVLAALLVVPAQAKGKVSFAVGGSKGVFAFWEEICDDFTSKTGIPVEIMELPRSTSQKRQPLTEALGNKRTDPDVILMDVAWIADFADHSWLEPLDRYAAKGTGFDKSNYLSNLLVTTDTYNKQLVALPNRIDGGLLYYRTDLLEKYGNGIPPKTWEELVAMSQKAQTGERAANPMFYGFVWQGAKYEGFVCCFLELAGKQGGFQFANGQLVFDTPANRRALELMKSMVSDAGISPPQTPYDMKEEGVRMYFQEGNAMFERNWPYAWKRHQADDSPIKGKVGLAPIPANAPGEGVSTLGGWHLAMSAFSDSKDEAWQFIRFVNSPSSQKKLALLRGNAPALRSVYTDDEVEAALPHFPDIRNALEQATPRPVIPEYPELSGVLQRYGHAYITGQESLDAVMMAMERDMRKVMAQSDVK